MGIERLSTRQGKYARSKFRALGVLHSFGEEIGRGGYLSTRELCLLGGVPYRSLSKLLPHWLRCEYVERRYCSALNCSYEYKITVRGLAWLSYALEVLPNSPLFTTELKSWLSLVLPQYSSLAELSFKELVKYVATSSTA